MVGSIIGAVGAIGSAAMSSSGGSGGGGGGGMDPAMMLMQIQLGQAASAQQQKQMKPYTEAGEQALGQYMAALGGNVPDWSETPDFEFGMEHGTDTLQSAFAGGGNLLSGNAMQGVLEYGIDYSTQHYQNYYQQYMNDLYRMLELGGTMKYNMGSNYLNTVTGGAGAAMNYAGQMAGLDFQQGMYQDAQQMGALQELMGAGGMLTEAFGGGGTGGGYQDYSGGLGSDLRSQYQAEVASSNVGNLLKKDFSSWGGAIGQ